MEMITKVSLFQRSHQETSHSRQNAETGQHEGRSNDDPTDKLPFKCQKNVKNLTLKKKCQKLSFKKKPEGQV